jgi:protein-tyrosine phosphatase
MIDLHCHILPGLDDGADTVIEAIDMARKAVSQGITHILCTPHHNRNYQNPKNKVIKAVETFQKELDIFEIPLVLFEGQEVRISDLLLEDIRADEILFVDVTNRYLLVEFPANEVPLYAEQILYKLCKQGIRPIIVHPERNGGFQKEPSQLVSFLNMGCLAQVTAPSIVGRFGKKVQRFSFQLIEYGLVHMVASDAHGANKRDFYYKEAYDLIAEKFGENVIKNMDQTCKDIVNGDEVSRRKYGSM